jgi:hypothetical protein
VEDVTLTYRDNTNSGRISRGELRISGHLVPSAKKVRKWDHTPHGAKYETYDTGYTKDRLRVLGKSFYFLMVYEAPRRAVQPTQQSSGRVYGLIVEPTDESSQTYRRIRMFCHLWGDVRMSGDEAGPEEFPEFLHWDSNSFERHIITII